MLAIAVTMILAFADPAPSEPGAKPPEPTPAATTEPAKKAKADGERLVCRREAKANSRFTTKVCKTADEWEQRAETARQAFADTQQRPMVSIDKGS
jgi:hypothetical protein